MGDLGLLVGVPFLVLSLTGEPLTSQFCINQCN